MTYILARDIPYEQKQLWAQVVRRAVFDYVLYKGSGQHALEWKRAFQYIFSENVLYENGLGFEEVCALFGWEPDYLRRLTTKLTRSDIKRMELERMKEEFVFDLISVVVKRNEKWKTSGAAVPFFPFFDYSTEYRQKMELKIISRESYLEPVPLVKWQTAAA